MRRSIKSSQLGCRIIAIKVSIDTNTATSSITVGSDDVASISFISTGILDVTFKDPFQVTPIVLGTSVTLGNRAGALKGSETTNLKARVFITNSSGTAADDDAYFFIIGRDVSYVDKFQKHAAEVKGTRTKPKLLLFHVDGTGTAAMLNGKYDATLVDNGTGDYTLTMDYNFSSTPICVGCATGTEASLAVTASSVSAITVKTTNAAAAATDSDFYLAVLGWESTSEHGRRRIPIQSTQRKCRLLPFQVAYSTGTPSAGLGSTLTSGVDDDGTGDFGINFSDAFKRSDPVVISCASEVAGSFAHVVGSATTAEVDVVDNAGSATDEAVDVCVFGFDSSDQTGGN